MPVGNPKIMNDQLLHLVFASGRPQCTIRVIPASAGPRGVAAGSFAIFGYPEDSPVVYLEHQSTSEFLANKRELMVYRELLKRLASVALTEAESTAFFASMATEFDRQGVGHHDQELA